MACSRRAWIRKDPYGKRVDQAAGPRKSGMQNRIGSRNSRRRKRRYDKRGFRAIVRRSYIDRGKLVSNEPMPYMAQWIKSIHVQWDDS